MDQITSPDIPALCCYFIVVSVGMVVSAVSINQLLKDTPGRWAFLDTWILFWANTAVPVLLFWFLDYTGALRDTSLFGALVVGFGYHQVFTGGIKGILMPGQSARLWQPYEAWVNKVAARISVKNHWVAERYFDRVRRLVAERAELLKAMERVTFYHSKDATLLQTKLDELKALPGPTGATQEETDRLKQDRLARKLLEELRTAEPVNFAHYLYQNKIIPWHYRSFLLGKARSGLFSAVAVGLVAALLTVGLLVFVSSPGWRLRYHQWRMIKPNTSEPDRFRSREFLQTQVRQAAQGTNAPAAFAAIYGPLVKPLRYRAAPVKQAEEIHQFLFHSRVGKVDCWLVPQLIESLRTDSLDLRARANQLLNEIQRASYTNAPAPTWQPLKEDPAHVVDEKINLWGQWWRQVSPCK